MKGFTAFECATLALLDYLVRADVRHGIVAVDPNESRRAKMQKIYDALPGHARGQSGNEFIVADISDAPKVVQALGPGRMSCRPRGTRICGRGRFGWCSRDRLDRWQTFGLNALPCSSRPIWCNIFLRCSPSASNTVHRSRIIRPKCNSRIRALQCAFRLCRCYGASFAQKGCIR